VELVRFDESAGKPVEQYRSTFTLSPLTVPDASVKAACFHVPPGGVVGFHEATVPQLFCVVAGSGWVTGADRERVPVGPFEGAFWEAGEWHESGSDAGMTVVVLEGDVQPYRPTA
jgi:mannose-6-phosphate isomerase-like protein (cupin superfamily)